MPTIVFQLAQRFRQAINSAFGVDADPMVGPSQSEQFGDYQSNAAMSLAKTVGAKPREVAEKIVARLDLSDMAAAPTIAGPGFINVRLSNTWLAKELQKLPADRRLGIEKTVRPQTVVVDYSGPNVAKEMHVGHLRSTIIGDAISRVLEFQGNTIIRQNHIGDWGTQFGMLIQYVEELKDASGAVTGVVLSDWEEFYRRAKEKFDGDPEFASRARQAVVRLQNGESNANRTWKLIRDLSLSAHSEVYTRLGVLLALSDERGESAYNADLPGIVTDLKKAGLAVESDGATVVFIDGEGKPPLIVQKTDGGYLYATTDLAAIRYRISQLHANRIVYVHDSRQAHHFAQVFATAKKAGWASDVSLEYAPFGTMLGEDGKPFKTRTGGTVKLKELLDEAEQRALAVVTEKNAALPEEQKTQIARAVGIGGVKYSDLAKDRISDYVFSFDKMLALDGNTAPYLQYAHARIQSIFRKAQAASSTGVQIDLTSPFELALAKHILRFGEVVEIVARELKPHHLCTYLYDLATKFSGFYENCPVLQSDDKTRASRLALCELTARTLESGLDLLGIEHPDQM
ncbi:MAG TPA: arginine--tRNA ligase [Tepidisphaeraceae bacterium]|nr:arginine--tRNA ligase [Tepidisphaeraceae bacterium]